ncbi:MAG: MFS transporter [Pseudomonadales bacterium]|nr:MFS transporter [Halioglobus sp.]MCP5122804.1 MFS transporter [Pseudomonadales bacterium]MCP5193965.1 MFS transporter [Pseudomonadales bacterium]
MTALERRSVSSLALLYSFRMLGLFMVLPLLSLYAGDMPGATPSLIGLALGAYGLTQAALQLPLGWLSDQVGRKPVIIGGLLVFALGSVLAATADSLWGIVIGRAVQGAGAIAATVMALVADLTSTEQRTKAMAIVGMSIGLSFAVALVLGPVIAAVGGLASVFWVTALLAGGGIAIVALLVPTPDAGAVMHSDVGARPKLFGRALRDPALLRLNFGVFSLHFILMACFLVVPGALEQLAGVDRAHHWQVYLPVLVLSVVGMLPLMRIAERGGRPREMFLCGIALLALAIPMLGLASSAIVLYLALWLFFVGFNYLEATLPSQVSKSVFAGGKGTALGIYSTCQFLGTFAGGAGGGWLVQHFGQLSLVGLCLGLALAWWLLMLGAALTPVPVPDPEHAPGTR